MLNRTCWLMLFIFAIGYLHVYMWWPDMVFNFYAVRKSFHLLIKPLQTSWRVSNIVIVSFFFFLLFSGVYFRISLFSFCFLVEFQSNRCVYICLHIVTLGGWTLNHFSYFFFLLTFERIFQNNIIRRRISFLLFKR